MSRHRRGQSLVELTLVLPILLALVAVPVAFGAWAGRRVTALEHAREGAWTATAGALRSSAEPDVRVRVRRTGAGVVRAEARVAAPPPTSPFLRPQPGGPGAPESLEGALELNVLPLDAGTEAAGVREVRARWLGGRPGAPIRALMKLFIRDEPIRVDFDARPSTGHER